MNSKKIILHTNNEIKELDINSIAAMAVTDNYLHDYNNQPRVMIWMQDNSVYRGSVPYIIYDTNQGNVGFYPNGFKLEFFDPFKKLYSDNYIIEDKFSVLATPIYQDTDPKVYYDFILNLKCYETNQILKRDIVHSLWSEESLKKYSNFLQKKQPADIETRVSRLEDLLHEMKNMITEVQKK